MICTSTCGRTSTRLSPGFILIWYSSLFFGSQRRYSFVYCSARPHKQTTVRSLARLPALLLSLRVLSPGFLHPNARSGARLLGSCYKTRRVTWLLTWTRCRWVATEAWRRVAGRHSSEWRPARAPSPRRAPACALQLRVCSSVSGVVSEQRLYVRPRTLPPSVPFPTRTRPPMPGTTSECRRASSVAAARRGGAEAPPCAPRPPPARPDHSPHHSPGATRFSQSGFISI